MNHTFLKIALFLVIVGAINWGHVGLFYLNLVATFFGDSIFSNILYIVIGLCGIANLSLLFSDQW